MEPKKWPSRFTVNFDMEDPEAQQVADVLNQLGGHKKAKFIVKAVLCYLSKYNHPLCNFPARPGTPSTPPNKIQGSHPSPQPEPQPSMSPTLSSISDDDELLRKAMAAFGLK